jgi:Protein of unknown function (DUF3750)
MFLLRACLLLLALLYMLPLSVAAMRYFMDGTGAGWRTADRSSIGYLPPASQNPDAVVRIFAAQTVRWRGVFAAHCWIVLKPAGAADYTRYDYTAWSETVRLNGFEPDGRWFGHVPEVVFAADGETAAALIPRMQMAIRTYGMNNQGEYRAWPGPNSNTFVAAVMDAVPETRTALPPTAIGKDYPYDGRWLRLAPSGTGVKFTLNGYVGLTVAWIEGIEVNILGAVAGLDLRRPAIKLPGLGRLGMPALDGPATPPLSIAARNS